MEKTESKSSPRYAIPHLGAKNKPSLFEILRTLAVTLPESHAP